MRNNFTFSLIAGAAVLLFSCTKEVPPPLLTQKTTRRIFER